MNTGPHSDGAGIQVVLKAACKGTEDARKTAIEERNRARDAERRALAQVNNLVDNCPSHPGSLTLVLPCRQSKTSCRGGRRSERLS